MILFPVFPVAVLLTQSVGQMTDATLQWTASTQTAMPRIIASSNWTDLLGGPIRPEENHHNHMMKHEDVIDPTFAVWENLWEQPADRSTRVEWANREYDIEKRCVVFIKRALHQNDLCEKLDK